VGQDRRAAVGVRDPCIELGHLYLVHENKIISIFRIYYYELVAFDMTLEEFFSEGFD
jgi:hypothetical protein